MEAGQTPFLGSKISLISKSEIRYEGILYTIDTIESTVALAKVRSYGTEDRPTDRPVAPREEVYEYIIFRGSDIKDIRVCQPPKPQPTLQGGLPNDPAILQHSASGVVGQFPPGGASPTGTTPSKQGQPGGNQLNVGAFGPIGSGTSYGQGQANVSSVGPTGAKPASPALPVIDILKDQGLCKDQRRSNGSSPVVGLEGRSDHHASDGSGGTIGRGGINLRIQNRGDHSRGRGGMVNFHRGRGRGGGQSRGGNQRFTNNNRTGFVPGRPMSNKKDTLKFDGDYDFEEANVQFQEVLQKLQKAQIDDEKKEPKIDSNDATKGINSDSPTNDDSLEDGEIKENDADNSASEIFYDKKKSFFDSISCEALERNKGNSQKPDWRAEKKLNKETFGVPGHMGGGRGRGNYYNNRGRGNRGGGGYRGGRGNYGGFGGYNNYNDGFNNYGGGRFSRDQRGSTGGSNRRGGFQARHY